MKGMMAWVDNNIFAKSNLPVKFNADAVKTAPKLWNLHTLTITSPPTNMTEQHMWTWLNNIASNLSAVHKIVDNPSGQCDHSFDSRTTTKGPFGGYILCRPDICVIDWVNQHNSRQTQEEQLHWCKVYAFVEVTANNSNLLQNVSLADHPTSGMYIVYLTCSLIEGLPAQLTSLVSLPIPSLPSL
jgi:hypothetical protein